MAGVPSEMRALRAEAKGDKYYTLKTVPTPQPKGCEALIKVGAAGFCHTDLMVLNGDFGDNFPLTGSHEPCGTVVGLGPEVQERWGVRIGQRVAGLLHLNPCGRCADCKFGDWKYCSFSQYAGITADGAFAEYAIVGARHLVPLPDNMSFEQAAPLTCAGITIYTALKKANLKHGQGLKVVGIDARSEPIEMKVAKDALEQISELREPVHRKWPGADAVILTADPLSSQRFGLDIVRKHGLVIYVSQPPEIKLDFHDLIFKDLTIVGSLHGNSGDLRETIELCAQYGIESTLSRFSIDQGKELVDSVYHDGRKGKSVSVF